MQKEKQYAKKGDVFNASRRVELKTNKNRLNYTMLLNWPNVGLATLNHSQVLNSCMHQMFTTRVLLYSKCYFSSVVSDRW